MARDFGLLISISGLIVLLHFRNFVHSGKPQVPCYFIFGDSHFDSGNTNELKTAWKANYPPYGIDFPKGHTGRFTNGRTVADVIGQLLGFDEFIPTYATATDDQISKGVNYASGGAGILGKTGVHNGERASLYQQMVHHNLTVARISRVQKDTAFLKECIYVINIGTNDYTNNFHSFEDHYDAPHIYAPNGYVDVLMQQYTRQLKVLYNLGGRKVALFGLIQLGCTPFIIERFRPSPWYPCETMVDDSVYIFNERLKFLVEGFNKDKPDVKFTYINTTNIFDRKGAAPAPPPAASPIRTTTPAYTKLFARPCCPIYDEWQCAKNSVPCPNRKKTSTYFDSVHLTEFSNIAIGNRAYKAQMSTDAYPYDIQHLTEAVKKTT
ncbi:GDSL esterase/lipase At5g45670-like [Bidens hawaiensis]|uniref:GDSL esterase/lipase At5g45670-like n=1 Tax=Bidens hawaiensis TaxID=980011 RepID=UPI00404A91E4